MMMTSGAAQNLPQRITTALAAVLPPPPVALHEPAFNGNEWLYLKQCLDSTFVSSVGPFVDRFERDMADYTGAGYAVAVVNGTAALHIALQLAGVMPGDEVLLPSLSFIATANAIHYCGATPHFIDSEARTLGVDADKLRVYLQATTTQHQGVCLHTRTDKPIRAMMPMHTFGHAVDLEALQAIARDFNLVIVEDAAESLGSYYQGQHTGTFGRLGAFSFNGNKTITTGGGGVIVTHDKALAQRAKHLTTTAKLPHAWTYEHDAIGYNYRMPNLNAALGCAQLEQLAQRLAAKRQLYTRYATAFNAIEGVSLFSEPQHCQSNYWLQTLLLDRADGALRDAVLTATHQAGYMTRPAWNLLHTLVPYAACPRMDLAGATQLAARIINIPSSAALAGSEA